MPAARPTRSTTTQRLPRNRRPLERNVRNTRHLSWLPGVLTIGLLALTRVPRIADADGLVWSVWAAAGALSVWQLALWSLGVWPPARTSVVGLRRQHYIQALAQGAVFAYWGWHWPPVYDHAWMLVAQLLFAYAFDMLLTATRRGQYVLGFGPFPIIFSTNLFLWFRDEWFALQFVMIAVGFLGKAFVQWRRDNRDTHIFNPSAFSLGLFSLVLLATGTTELTWGPEIATTLSLAPRIYLFLFLVGLVVMYFFSITLMAGSAAAMLFGLSAISGALTGVPYFVDSEIPTAVFLGLHLLVTDPSTSPRTAVGKAIFGALYGVGVFGLYGLLGAAGLPTFYDKLLCVPLLNLSVQGIDRLARRVTTWSPDRPIPGTASANAFHMAVWILFFGAMTAVGSTDGTHRGDKVPFWEQRCRSGHDRACRQLLQIEASYCRDSAGWACNELGVYHRTGAITPSDPDQAYRYLARGCELRFQAACVNLLNPDATHRAVPRVFDLRLLLREGGPNLLDEPEAMVLARACDHGWMFACQP